MCKQKEKHSKNARACVLPSKRPFSFALLLQYAIFSSTHAHIRRVLKTVCYRDTNRHFIYDFDFRLRKREAQWKKALELLRDVKTQSFQPNGISYTASTDCLRERGGCYMEESIGATTLNKNRKCAAQRNKFHIYGFDFCNGKERSVQ